MAGLHALPHAPQDAAQGQRLDGRIALVTGAAGGIGAAVLRAFAQRGARVIGVDMAESAEALAAVIGELPGDGHRALTGSVADSTDIDRIVTAAVDEAERIDILVNAAGVNERIGPTLDKTEDEWRRVIDVNLTGLYLMSHAVAKVMTAQRSGVVLNITSIGGVVGLPMRPAYSASKAGVAMLTRVLGAEWAKSGIRVNSVSPGYVRTRMTERLIEQGMLDEAQVLRRTPMGDFVTPEDIAETLAFLASDQAAFVTGVDLKVDGGYMAWGAPSDANEVSDE